MNEQPTPTAPSSDLTVSKQTAGGVTGAILGGVVGGPLGAVAGAIAGAFMGNRAAEGKPALPASTTQVAKTKAKAVKDKLPSLPGKETSRKTGTKLTKKAVTSGKRKVAGVKKAVTKALPKTKTKAKKRGK